MKPFRRLKVGSRLGDITIVGVVAEVRGRHPVYLAWSHSQWCPVALKVFRTGEDAKRESDMLECVAHPNIVRSFGARSPRFMLMEYLEGSVLDRLVHDAPMKADDALRIGVHIGAALVSVHAAGYLHLDLKPGNVIIASGKPILFDFGAAKPIGYRASRPIGTDGYIAPELLKGQPLSPAADVFGLGVTLIELITGEAPFDHPNANTIRPSVLATLYAKLKPGAAEVLLDATATDPAKRPQLDALLTSLNHAIRRGPKMWPQTLQPAGNLTRRSAA